MTGGQRGLRAWLRQRLRRASGHDQLAKRLSRTEAVQERQAQRLSRLDERLRKQKELFEQTKLAAWKAQSLHEILSAQFGAIEERLQDLTEKVEIGSYDATDDETAAGRTLLEEVREEHRRIRVRFGVVTSFEERVRRLESALAEEIAAATELAREAGLNGALANAPTHGAVDIPEDPEDASARP